MNRALVDMFSAGLIVAVLMSPSHRQLLRLLFLRVQSVISVVFAIPFAIWKRVYKNIRSKEGCAAPPLTGLLWRQLFGHGLHLKCLVPDQLNLNLRTDIHCDCLGKVQPQAQSMIRSEEVPGGRAGRLVEACCQQAQM